MRAVGDACATMASLTKSSTSSTVAAWMALSALMVSSSGSPGPAPTSVQLPPVPRWGLEGGRVLVWVGRLMGMSPNWFVPQVARYVPPGAQSQAESATRPPARSGCKWPLWTRRSRWVSRAPRWRSRAAVIPAPRARRAQNRRIAACGAAHQLDHAVPWVAQAHHLAHREQARQACVQMLGVDMAHGAVCYFFRSC